MLEDSTDLNKKGASVNKKRASETTSGNATGFDGVAQATEFSDQSSTLEAMLATQNLIITEKRLRDFTMNSFRSGGGDTRGFMMSGFQLAKSIDERERSVRGEGRTSVLTNHKGNTVAATLVPPVFAPINQIGYPTITPKFLNKMDLVSERHRQDMDRLQFEAK